MFMETRNKLALLSYGFDTFVLGGAIAYWKFEGATAGLGILLIVALVSIVAVSLVLFVIGKFFPAPAVVMTRYSGKGLAATVVGLILGVVGGFLCSLIA